MLDKLLYEILFSRQWRGLEDNLVLDMILGRNEGNENIRLDYF